MKRIALLLLCLGSLNPLVSGQVDQAALQSDAEEQSKLEYAGAQYEIVAILMEEGKYEAVISQFRTILKLGLKDETLVLSSTLDFAVAAIEREQYGVAHQIVDDAVSHLRERAKKYTLLMHKAKFLKDQGKLQEAIEVYQKTQQLRDPQD